MFDSNSTVASVVQECHHQMDFDNVKVVGHELHYHQRLFLEAWMSVKDPNVFQCTVISTFWHAFQNWWFEKTLQTFDLSERNVIYGWYNNTQFKDTLNYVALVAKYFIFCCI